MGMGSVRQSAYVGSAHDGRGRVQFVNPPAEGPRTASLGNFEAWAFVKQLKVAGPVASLEVGQRTSGEALPAYVCTLDLRVLSQQRFVFEQPILA